jgi:hypothetical protein
MIHEDMVFFLFFQSDKLEPRSFSLPGSTYSGLIAEAAGSCATIL